MGPFAGGAQGIRSMFAGGKDDIVRDKVKKIDKRRIDPAYPFQLELTERIKALVFRYYKEGAFEKTQFSRKWMRNVLMYQGYHELEWSEINVAWEAIIRDSGDYAFPNNYLRSHVNYGTGMYVKNAPAFTFRPTADDFDAQQMSEAARHALDMAKQNIAYDQLRALEAVNLRLFGNSFRYTFYSIDPRFGTVSSPVYQDREIQLDEGYYQCDQCNEVGEGLQLACPTCGSTDVTNQPPALSQAQVPVSQTEYPRGQECTEVINPLEVYVRASAKNQFEAPYIIRARAVDKVVLQSAYPEVEIQGTEKAGEDLSLIYQESLADLPGDPTQYAAWYERATSNYKTIYIQAWLRPSLYFHDDEMMEKFPDGLCAFIAGETLLEARNKSMDDQWAHFIYNPVPGRFWGDGDDDLIPKQLQLNEVERLIIRNIAYNSVPQTYIDSSRINKNAIVNDPGEINEVKPGGGRPISQAIFMTPGQELPNEVHVWRADILKDFEYHSGVFGSAIGEHQPGVDTLGGQQMFAARTEQNLGPEMLHYKEANELWARQMLKVVAENWLDERVHAVQGINGNWEFTKLRGALMDVDRVQIEARIITADPAEQQALIQAISVQALNPQDPRVVRKLLEVFNLPTDLDGFSMDAKVQWKEIELMKKGQQVMPLQFVHNDSIHAEVCRLWLNSDEADTTDPEIRQMVYEHLLQHLMHMGTQMKLGGAMTAHAQEGADSGGPGAGGGDSMGGGDPGQQEPPGLSGAPQAGGSKQPSHSDKQMRARKGQAARPKGQPSHGNQYGRRAR